MKILFVVLVASIASLSFAAFVLGGFEGHEEEDIRIIDWRVYKAIVVTDTARYQVEVSETLSNTNRFKRLVFLTPLKINGEPEDFKGITGHAYGTGNQWARIFLEGYHKSPDGSNSGCNSVVRGLHGWEFEPCGADKGIAPFTAKEISFAMLELERALEITREPENLVIHEICSNGENQYALEEK